MFSVAIVDSSKALDGFVIVEQAVKFWDVKLLAYAKVNKDFLVIMEAMQGVLKAAKSLTCMRWKLSQKSKIKEHAHSAEHAC